MKHILPFLALALVFVGCKQKGNVTTQNNNALPIATFIQVEENGFEAEIELFYDSVNGYSAMGDDSVIAQKINHVLLSTTMGEYYNESINPFEAIQGAKAYYDEILAETVKELNLSEEDGFPFALSYKIRIKDLTEDFVIFEVSTNANLGGAHGSEYTYFYIFDMSNGELITEKDFLSQTEETVDAISLLLVDAIKQFCVENENYEFSDYDQNNIAMNGNFYLLNDGLVYFYNPYDIAPYAFGTTEVYIPAEMLKPYIVEGSIVANYWAEVLDSDAICDNNSHVIKQE